MFLIFENIFTVTGSSSDKNQIVSMEYDMFMTDEINQILSMEYDMFMADEINQILSMEYDMFMADEIKSNTFNGI